MLTVEDEVVKLEALPKQSSSQGFWLGGLVLLILVALVSAIAIFGSPVDAYTQEVLSLSGDATKGRSIFVMNCVACHGQWGNGKVGPSLRDVSNRLSKAQLVHQVVSGDTPPMPQFQPKPQEMADLLIYLKGM